jgi:hypothetical protein
MKQWIILVIIIFILSGCATKYQSIGITGGYTETRLGNNIFAVSFKGNGFTSRERTKDFTLLRSAELTLKNGYKYFIIKSSENYTRHSTYTTPTHTNINGNVYGNTFYGSTTTYGGRTYNISKPVTNYTIICFKEKPKNNTIIYEANFIIKSIKEKYGIK